MSSEKFQPTWATKPKPPAAAPSAFDVPYSDAKPTSTGPVLYRPQRPSSPQRRRRGFCCSCLFFTFLLFIILLLLASITAAILYSIYHPHRPNFSLSSLHISSLNLSSSALFSSNLSLSLSSHNPNSKISFSYHPSSLSILSSSLLIASGKLPAFLLLAKNTTHLGATATSKGLSVSSSEISEIKSAVKREKGLDLEIRMETKARVRVGKSGSKKIKVRVSCTGIKAATDSKEKFSGRVKTSGVKCKVKLRFKIWKWNLSC